MMDDPGVLDLADELAEIARTTLDPVTGDRLMSVVRRLLEGAGLPPDCHGGGYVSTGWMYELICEPA